MHPGYYPEVQVPSVFERFWYYLFFPSSFQQIQLSCGFPPHCKVRMVYGSLRGKIGLMFGCSEERKSDFLALRASIIMDFDLSKSRYSVAPKNGAEMG
jgi:hypothetical protein